MLFDLEDLRLLPEDMLHSLALKILERHKAKLTKEMLKRHLANKDLQSSEFRIATLERAILVLIQDRDVKARRARLRIV